MSGICATEEAGMRVRQMVVPDLIEKCRLLGGEKLSSPVNLMQWSGKTCSLTT